MARNSPLRFWWLTLKDEHHGTLRHIVKQVNDPHTLCKQSTNRYKSAGWCITEITDLKTTLACPSCIKVAQQIFMNLIKEEPLTPNV